MIFCTLLWLLCTLVLFLFWENFKEELNFWLIFKKVDKDLDILEKFIIFPQFF